MKHPRLLWLPFVEKPLVIRNRSESAVYPRIWCDAAIILSEHPQEATPHRKTFFSDIRRQLIPFSNFLMRILRTPREPFFHELIAPIRISNKAEKFVLPDAEMIEKNAICGKRVTERPNETGLQRACKMMPGFVHKAWQPDAACKHIGGTAKIHCEKAIMPPATIFFRQKLARCRLCLTFYSACMAGTKQETFPA